MIISYRIFGDEPISSATRNVLLAAGWEVNARLHPDDTITGTACKNFVTEKAAFEEWERLTGRDPRLDFFVIESH